MLVKSGHSETTDRSMFTIVILGLVQLKMVSPWTPGVITDGDAVTASNKCRNFVRDFLLLYVLNTHQSDGPHTY